MQKILQRRFYQLFLTRSFTKMRQNTNWKDKNKKEIFENDLFVIDGHVYEIVQLFDEWLLININLPDIVATQQLMQHLEVIGNSIKYSFLIEDKEIDDSRNIIKTKKFIHNLKYNSPFSTKKLTKT